MVRKQLVGAALAVGLFGLTGAGFAAAATTTPATTAPAPPCSTTTSPAPAPTTVSAPTDTASVTPAPTAVPTRDCVPSAVPTRRIGVVPKGAPQTGGGGMATEVGSWFVASGVRG